MTVSTNVQLRPTTDRARTDVLIAPAARTVPPLWALSGAIAVNPLAGLEQRPFADALRDGARLFDARAGSSLTL